MVLGYTAASKETRPLDCKEIFVHAERTEVDLRGDTGGKKGDNPLISRCVVQGTCRDKGR